MPKGYTTKEAIENYMLIKIDSSFDAQINSWIEAVETYIDRYTRRDFTDTEFYPSIPADITLVATALVAGIINFSNNHEGEVQSMTVGRYSVTFKNDQQFSNQKQIEDILKSYKKFTF
jgi:hypothetical protein